MLVLLRKLIIFTIVAAGSVAIWEVADIPTHIGLSHRNPSSENSSPVAAKPTDKPSFRTAPAGQRLLVWVLFVLLLPVVTAPLAGRVIDRQSNTANVLLLFGYTGLGILAAYIVNGVHVGSIWSALLYLLGLLAIFAYNLWMCAFIASLRSK